MRTLYTFIFSTLSVICLGQNPITAEFVSRGELNLVNTSENTLKVTISEDGYFFYNEYIYPSAKQTVYRKFKKRRVKDTKIYYTYDQKAYETDITIIKRQIQNEINRQRIAQQEAAFWKGLDQFFTGGKISKLLGIVEYVDKAGKGDWKGMAEDYMKGQIEDKIVEQAGKNSSGFSRKALESLVVAGIALMETAEEAHFPHLESKTQRCLNRFKNEGLVQQGGDNLWDSANNTAIFNAFTPPVIIELANVDVQRGEKNDEIHSVMGATDEKFDWYGALALPLTPSHLLGNNTHARLYAIGSYESHSFKVQTDFILALQKLEGTNYQTTYAIRNQSVSPYENKIVIQNTNVGLGGRYMIFFPSDLVLAVEGGVMRNMSSKVEMISKDILQRNSTGSLISVADTPNLNNVSIFKKEEYFPYGKISFGVVFKENNRKFLSPFIDFGYFWKAPKYDENFRIVQLVKTTGNFVAPSTIASFENFWTINAGLKFGF